VEPVDEVEKQTMTMMMMTKVSESTIFQDDALGDVGYIFAHIQASSKRSKISFHFINSKGSVSRSKRLAMEVRRMTSPAFPGC
jgi:hypothetical protein